MGDDVQVYEFTIVPVYERYYSEDTAYAIYNFTTKDDIPEYSEYKDPFSDSKVVQKMSTIVGKMQRLYLGMEYNVKAICEYNHKYNSYQYLPQIVVSVAPKDYDSQALFLKTLTTERLAINILNEYPNVVEDVISGNLTEIDYRKVNGVREITWNRIKNAIIDNYVISDIITMLQPLGVTYNMIKKLLNEEPNPELLKNKLDENPYIMTKIKGLGFKRVDELALKLKPELKVSMHRLVAFVTYTLREVGENDGHTWLTKTDLCNKISDNISECYDLFDGLLQSNDFLYIENDRIGLLYYRKIEQRTFEILYEKTNSENTRFNFVEEEVDKIIKSIEEEQGFNYTEEQLLEIKSAINSNVFILSGKAGTGKTSISKAILRIYTSKNYRIMACALSAKASQRITEATGFIASTIHRTLGAVGLNQFTYNYDNPLPTDVLFVDEASMINARLFYDLLCAVGERTRIIISGDNMQLPPIGFGNIFSDILSRNDVFNSHQLTKVMRQAEMSGILSDANQIRDGINPISTPDLKIIHGELKDMYYMFRENREALQSIAIKTYLTSIENDGIDEVVLAVPRKQDCINSSMEINKIIQDKLLGDVSTFIDTGYAKYYLGAKVMQTVNDYEKNVFNGEIGYITKIEKRTEGKKTEEYCTIAFKTLQNDKLDTLNDKVIEYKKSELASVELAYAMTVHKLQGSGYKTVIGIIDDTHYILLDNCMLYTMLTRAKKRCLLLAGESAFNKCIKSNHNTNRQTWFKELKYS